ncbi:fumarylacetoacetate hydrolase family protein [Pelomonas sp. KK5]|uniref:fumarylacetoacetate hydrolase family protein n=1 Tax=Pelomonas sp. KK5 TaxID=1855730 RepID=UPI00097BC372|nr:fumarylacetoacetate hydrolase family protein [Pelomonas sp. KK5]
MKLATLRDGRLVLVSRDLRLAIDAEGPQGMLDLLRNWARFAPALQDRYSALNAGALQAFAFDPAQAAAPLPRPSQWLDGSVFENHGRLMERAFNSPPADYTQYPMVYQGNADDIIAATDDVRVPSESDGMDIEGELGVLLDETPLGTRRADALAHIRLLVLINDVSLRAHAPREMKTGFGWIRAKPSTALSPVAVTPDELGDAWHDGRCALDLHCHLNGEWFGQPNGREATFGFDQLIEYVAYSRPLRAGTLIGSGTFSNADRAAGSTCISERRAIEMIDHGQPTTPFMRFGDRVRLEMFDAGGHSIFGAIDQRYLAT